MTIATDVALRARRVAADAQAQLARGPQQGLDRETAERLIAAIGELAGQIDELNRLLFAAECELHYAGEATAATSDED